MFDQNIPVQERPQSKIDDALVQFKENIESLGTSITNLEIRLDSVTNDYPRPSLDEPEKNMEKPTGDSALLLQMYSINAKLNKQTNRIQTLLERLDI